MSKLIFVLLILTIGCAPTMAERASDPSCTVINQDDGTITIKCPDGTEANIDPQLVEGTNAGVDDAATSDDATSESDAGFDDAGTNDVEERIMHGSYVTASAMQHDHIPARPGLTPAPRCRSSQKHAGGSDVSSLVHGSQNPSC
jgi:hypothetical protein